MFFGWFEKFQVISLSFVFLSLRFSTINYDKRKQKSNWFENEAKNKFEPQHIFYLVHNVQ